MGKYIEVDEELKKLVEEKKSAREISAILGINYTTVHKKLRRLNINLYNYHNELKFDNTVFDVIDTEEKAYWLGFLFADGYVSPRNNSVEFGLKGSDCEHLSKFNTFVKNRNDIAIGVAKCNGKEFSRCRCLLTDKHFHDNLISLGCVPVKSKILKFPDLNIFKKDGLINHFLRGFFDGNGCIYFTKTGKVCINLVTTTEFANSIVEYYPNIFGVRTKDYRHPNNNIVSMSAHCSKAFKFLDLIYENSTISLKRKYEKYKIAVLHRNM